MLGAVVWQRNPGGVDADVDGGSSSSSAVPTFRQGVVDAFCPIRQRWVVWWQEATGTQTLLEFVTLTMLFVMLAQEGHVRIARRLQENAEYINHGDPNPICSSSFSPSLPNDTTSSTTPHPMHTGPNTATTSTNTTSPAAASRKRPKPTPKPTPKTTPKTTPKNTPKNTPKKNTKSAGSRESASKANPVNTTADKPKRKARTASGTGSRSRKRSKCAVPDSVNTPVLFPSFRLNFPCPASPVETDESMPPPPPPPPASRVERTVEQELSFGDVIVMPSYSQPLDPSPLFSFVGETAGGLFQFYVGPNLPFALFTREEVIFRGHS